MAPDTPTQVNEGKSGRDKISRYEVISQLGEGGMGVVYKAHDPDLNKIVAVKVIQTAMLNDEQQIRFQREARALKGLKHAAIPEVYNFAISRDGEPYLVMEFISGESLSQFLDKHRSLEAEYVVEIALQICEAMKHAHGRGITHRDLKPANVILTTVADLDFVVVKVIDFGLARLDEETSNQNMTKTGLIMGSPPYMSPEQIQGESVDHRSDIYSMGCILYEMLTGVPPFRGKSPLSTLTMHISEPHASLASHGVKDAELFEDMIAKALAKHPDKRYSNMEEMMEALYQIADRIFERQEASSEEPAPSADDSIASLRTTIIKRNKKRHGKKVRIITAVGAICLLVLAAFLCFINTLGMSSDPESQNKSLTSMWVLLTNEKGVLTAETANIAAVDSDFKQLIGLNGPGGLERIRAVTVRSQRVTGEGFKYILRAPLQFVNITSDSFSDAGLKSLSKIKTLHSLSLRGVEKITGQGLAYLTELPLTKLEITDSDLPPNTVQTISGCKKIHRLSFHKSQPVDFEHLPRLAQSMPNLDSLDLMGTGLTDDTLPNLGSLDHLRFLNIAGNDISDARLDVILNFPLKELMISETSVSDIGLASLSEIKTLVRLECKSCRGITERGVERFKQQLPQCDVESEEKFEVMEPKF